MTFMTVLSQLDSIGFIVLRLLASVLWQSSLLLLIGTVFAFTLRKRSAQLRFSFLLAAVVLIPLIPVIIAGFAHFDAPRMEINVIPQYTYIEPIDEPVIISSMPTPDKIVTEVTTDAASRGALDYPWALVTILYIIGAGAFLSLTLLGKFRIHSWKRNATVITDSAMLTVFTNARNSLGITRSFFVMESEDIAAPLTCGALHPIILLPEGYADSLNAEELRALAVHEFMHVKRYDPLVLEAVSFIRALFYFNPLIWFASRKIAELAETICDDAAVAHVNNPRGYAEMLVRLASQLPEHMIATELAAGFLFSRHSLLRRIELVLSDRGEKAKRLSKVAIFATAVTCLALFVTAMAMPLGMKGDAPNEGTLANAQLTVSWSPYPSSLLGTFIEIAKKSDPKSMIMNAGANPNHKAIITGLTAMRRIKIEPVTEVEKEKLLLAQADSIAILLKNTAGKTYDKKAFDAFSYVPKISSKGPSYQAIEIISEKGGESEEQTVAEAQAQLNHVSVELKQIMGTIYYFYNFSNPYMQNAVSDSVLTDVQMELINKVSNKRNLGTLFFTKNASTEKLDAFLINEKQKLGHNSMLVKASDNAKHKDIIKLMMIARSVKIEPGSEAEKYHLARAESAKITQAANESADMPRVRSFLKRSPDAPPKVQSNLVRDDTVEKKSDNSRVYNSPETSTNTADELLRIQGSVQYKNKSIIGADIYLVHYKSGKASWSTKTADDGSFFLTEERGFLEDDTVILAFHPDYCFGWYYYYRDGGNTVRIDLEKKRPLEYILTDYHDVPVDGDIEIESVGRIYKRNGKTITQTMILRNIKYLDRGRGKQINISQLFDHMPPGAQVLVHASPRGYEKRSFDLHKKVSPRTVMFRPEGCIEGRVSYEATGKPAMGVRLKARLKNNATTQTYSFSTITDEQGNYTFTNLPAGYAHVELEERNLSGVANRYDNIYVESRQTKKDIDIFIEEGCLIYGRIVDVDTGENVYPGEKVMLNLFDSYSRSHYRIPVLNDGTFITRAAPGRVVLIMRTDQSWQLIGSEKNDTGYYVRKKTLDLEKGKQFHEVEFYVKNES